MENVHKSHVILDEIESSKMILVLVESPLAASTPEGIALNQRYAKACMRDCLLRGYAPFASHLLYAQDGLLDDNVPEERALGIHAGLLWGELAEKSIVYTDLGISAGMERGIQRAIACGRDIEYRELGEDWEAKNISKTISLPLKAKPPAY